MSFMELESFFGRGFRIELADGSSEVLPVEVTGAKPTLASLRDYCEALPVSFEPIRGGWARYSAPGYLDCTSYCFAPVDPTVLRELAVEECIDSAENEARELYGEDEDEDEEAEQ